MTGQVLKWSVPVADPGPHRIGAGQVLHVACQHAADTVEVWTLEAAPDGRRRFVSVWGTGQLVPPGWAHIGSTVTAEGALVWHVFEERE